LRGAFTWRKRYRPEKGKNKFVVRCILISKEDAICPTIVTKLLPGQRRFFFVKIVGSFRLFSTKPTFWDRHESKKDI
jgi:hypothetical protein